MEMIISILELYETAQQIKYASRTDTFDSQWAEFLKFFIKRAWALFALREAIGDQAFKKSGPEYLDKYSFQSVKPPGFLW
jgi:aminopeptidase N